MKTKELGIVSCADLLRDFEDPRVSPDRRIIRVTTGVKVNSRGTTVNWDHFVLDETGVCVSAPRGYAKSYKGARFTDFGALKEY